MALAVVPVVAAGVIRVLGETLRYEERGVQGDGVQVSGVYAFWHRSLLLAACRFRGQGIAILISRSFDGELIARTVERLGFVVVRGSSSRGGASGLRGMERAYRDGRKCAVTADGPRGPAMIAKPGAAQLARLVGSNVGAFYLLPERTWVLRSWDGFLIPKPFSRVVVTWPEHVAADEAAVQAALDRAVAMAG